MPAGKLIFSQLTAWIHPEQFRRCVNRYVGNYKVCSFPCWDQFLAMTFAQLTYRESLADIEVCLRARSDQLYRMGFRAPVAHSTLADANRVRDWRIYADLAQLLIARARRLYAQDPLQVVRGPIPTLIAISDGKQADVCALDGLRLDPGAFYVLDRGYLDFQRLYRLSLIHISEP